MDNAKKIVVRTLLIIGLAGLVVALGFDYMLATSKNEISRKYDSQSGQFAKLKHDFDQVKLDRDTAKSQLAEAQRDLDDLRPDDQKMKDSIGAFALQAAACDTLKRTMNVRDPGV